MTINFERFNCSLKNFICGLTVDFVFPMIQLLKQFASGISYLHKRDKSLGYLQLDNLYIMFDHTYKPYPEEHFATVKLLTGNEVGYTQDKDNKKKD